MSAHSDTIPYVIIGSGIIGMQVAFRLLEKNVPASDIAILEQNIFPGEHSSSRNSGVLHAGLYYPEHSLKQTLCLEGNAIWDSLALKLNIPLNRVGKYVVATNESEIPELEKLFSFAPDNCE